MGNEAQASASGNGNKTFSKSIWKLDVPPRIKLFGGKVCAHALATKCNLAKRIPSVGMNCEICGALEESNLHALFLCPFAMEIWVGSTFGVDLLQGMASSATDVLGRVADILDTAQLGDFLAIMWECWNARNRFIFSAKDGWRGGLASRAVGFVKSFREMKEQEVKDPYEQNTQFWKPPDSGEVVLAGVEQQMEFHGAELEEARACLFALKAVIAHGFRRGV
ncbi:hypothetical protein Cgig2_009535 [Carnegiea gigantea]|uniref:Reverse transcriptase zinc-binding domain-containing protein n=1 Tax=Carnegiea gigantea TaxID=171969 RepID=A0A9Q1QFJ5_9CARY|nr:hypothetical protein Cgig2_009535 [Carnegiea gigantea]